MNTDNTYIQLIEQALASVPGPCRIHVGYSGGLDSTVLLHMLVAWQQARPSGQGKAQPLRAIHVNHQLLPQAQSWQLHCQQVCKQWQVELNCLTATVDQGAASLEQQARLARYQCFDEQVGAGEMLVLAHHRDDQVETLLQRLARGSGPLGLGAMTMVSQRRDYRIVRPLLELDREQLARYASHHKLNSIEDPSNQDDSFERNFLRNRILPLWRQQHPRLNQTLARSARLCQESSELLEQLAELDLGLPRPDGGLSLSRLEPLNTPRRNNLLRYWLRQQGFQPPSEVVLGRIEAEVMVAAEDAQPRVEWGSCCVRRFQSVLYCMDLNLPSGEQESIPFSIPFEPIRLPYGFLSGGLGSNGQTPFSQEVLRQAPLSVRFRQGGERLTMPGRPSKPLKDLFQEMGVPPWLRGVWPIVYVGERIAGLPGLLVCAGFEPQSPDDSLLLDWVQGG